MTEHLFARLTDVTDLEAALEAALAAHLADSTGAHAASAISFSPPETMSATDVQAAIEEIRADQRTLLDADLDLYLSPTGDDILGDGSIGNPWRQPQRVVDYLEEDVDIGGFRVDVHFADGSYDGVYNGNYQGGGVLYWRGNFTNPENVILGNVLNPNGFSVGSMNRLAVSDTEIWFNGFSMEPVQAPSIDSDPASAGVGKFLIFGDLDNFTDGRLILRGCQNNSTVMFGNIMDFGNFITVDGSALPASAGALLHSLSGDPFMASSLTITDNPSFSQGTIVVGPKSFAQIFWAYTGTTVGPKYLVVAGGQMFIDDPEDIPGTLPGKVEPTGFIRYTGPDGSFGNTAKLWDHVISKTAAYQLTGKDSYHHFNNQGTTTRVDFTLPNAGLDQYYSFTVADADGIRIIAKAGDTIRVKGTVTAAGGQIENFTIGSTIFLYAIDDTQWIALYYIGEWTAPQNGVFQDLDVDGNLNVDGNAQIDGTLDVDGAVDIDGAATVGGLITAEAGQIKFPATANPSGDANTLDDYEEGTWTPVFTFATPGDLNVAYSTQLGTYTKVGRLVTAMCTISLGTFTHTTAAGGAQITGLPFTSANDSQNAVGSTAWHGITKANYTQIGGFIVANDNKLLFFGFGSGVALSQIVAADMPTGGQPFLGCTITYYV
jgi:hypothetical protein